MDASQLSTMGSPTPLTVSQMLTDPTTLLSLGLVLLLIFAAYLFSRLCLSPTARKSTRFLFIWHVFDALIHFIFEGSFLYNCLFTYVTVVAPVPTAEAVVEAAAKSTQYATSTKSFLNYIRILASNTTVAQDRAGEIVANATAIAPVQLASNWLGHTDRLYGANFAGPENPFGALWRVYAQADFRWGVADANVVAIELLTVLIAGPLALYVAYLLAKGKKSAAIWMIVLATGEIYGGFMTFAPEWLTGSQNLDTSNWMYTYVYLFFFNTLWVWFPLYAIVWGYNEIARAFAVEDAAENIAMNVETKKTR